MSKRTFYLMLAGFSLIVLAACGQDDLPPPPRSVPLPSLQTAQIVVSTGTEKQEPPRYAYRGDRHRDPFIALNTEGVTTVLSDEVTIPKLGALSLKGIFDDGKQMVAIISSGGVTYILKGTQLYDNRQRLVKGITGIIRKERVLMIAPDKSTKELKLHEK